MDKPSPYDLMNLAVVLPRLYRRMGMTRQNFSIQFGFTQDELKSWEKSESKPEGTKAILLYVILREPKMCMDALAQINRLETIIEGHT